MTWMVPRDLGQATVKKSVFEGVPLLWTQPLAIRVGFVTSGVLEELPERRLPELPEEPPLELPELLVVLFEVFVLVVLEVVVVVVGGVVLLVTAEELSAGLPFVPPLLAPSEGLPLVAILAGVSEDLPLEVPAAGLLSIGLPGGLIHQAALLLSCEFIVNAVVVPNPRTSKPNTPKVTSTFLLLLTNLFFDGLNIKLHLLLNIIKNHFYIVRKSWLGIGIFPTLDTPYPLGVYLFHG